METLWAIIASLTRGYGSLSDIDTLRADKATCTVLGLVRVAEARRAGEWLSRLGTKDVKGLWNATVAFVGQVAPSILVHEVETNGYVPLFIDATGFKVDGNRSSSVTGKSRGRLPPVIPPSVPRTPRRSPISRKPQQSRHDQGRRSRPVCDFPRFQGHRRHPGRPEHHRM